jgi:phosphatidylserine/phosphatidylglycerophosphate/cardiolipin synthase-like enzyme
MVEFIERAHDSTFGLRVCAYEFHYPPILEALAKALNERGVDLQIIYDRRSDKPGDANELKVGNAGLEAVSIQRNTNPSYISHNKFIVLLENGAAKAVLTGGTNFSESGIFGHSNAVHVVEEPAIAAKYLRCWELLSEDPAVTDVAPILTEEAPLPEAGPEEGTFAIFSPREDLTALEWYARLAAEAEDALFATFAFGIHPLLQAAYRDGKAKLRYALLEKATRPMKKGPAREAEEAKIRELRAMPENRFAIGTHFEMNKFDRWLGERLSGLNRNIQYVHTKYMLIDPLGDDPVIIAGSANFSAASTTQNDENMLVIRGNQRVADIYLGEFMRLYNHYAFREWAAKQPAIPATGVPSPSHLRTDDWWKDYFGSSERARQREYFA